MHATISTVLILCTVTFAKCDNDTIAGIPFASSLSVGQAILLPKCDAHICPKDNSTKVDSSRLPMRCNCKEDCYQQRDCCLDALPDARVADLISTDLWSCVRTQRGHGPYVAIGRCPAKWENAGVRKACEDLTSAEEDPNRLLPVRSTRTNITYQNIYCGQCNEGELQPGQFQLRFRCNGGENVTSVPAAIAEKNCDAYIDETSASYCASMDRTVEECPETWKHENETYAREVKWRCRSYFGPITINATRYKNAFCALCNSVSWNLENVVCRNSYYPIEKEFMLSIDGEFNSGTLIPGGEAGKVCQPGEVFDPFKKQCRGIICVNRTDCNSTYTRWNDNLQSDKDLPSPCNMSLLDPGKFTRDEKDGKVTIQWDDGRNESYSIGEYEIIESGEHKGSILVCQRIGANAIPLFPQHFCERRQLLGYGSCGCETDCIQSRACCLDALGEDATRRLMARGEAWVCLNNSRRSSALAKCPGNFTDRQVRNACENPPDIEKDPILHVPVFAWDSSALYRNVFCAVCNGAGNVTFFDVRIQCPEHVRAHNGLEAAEIFVSEPGVCTMFTDSDNTDIPLKPCVEDPKCRQCPPSWGKNGDPREVAVLWRCQHYYAPVNINGVCYRNDFCAYCNDVNPTDPSLNRTFSSHMSQDNTPQQLKETFSTFTVG